MLIPSDFRQNKQREPNRSAGAAFAVCLLIGTSLTVAGCGSGGGAGRSTSPTTTQAGSRSASLTFSVTWPGTSAAPASGRAFPVAANSLTVTVTDSTGYSDTQTFSRPPAGSTNTTVTANFFALSAGRAAIVASAFASSDGSGLALSQTSSSVVLQAGQQTGTTLDFASPIVSLSLSPNAPAVLLGTSVQLTPTATNDRNVTSTPTGTYLSTNPGVATVDSSGKVTSLGLGTTLITFTDSVFGKSAQANVTVRGISQIVLTPQTPTINPGAAITLSATGNDANGVVQNNPPGVWSTSNATIATVDASGTVSGIRAGTVTISFKDNVFGVTGTTTVTVRGGDAQVIVQ